MLLSIIIPCYKEAENLKLLVPKVSEVLSSQDYDFEIIIVDDNSQDGTIELIDRLSKDYPVTLYTRLHDRGLSSAVLYGFNRAEGDWLLCMDGDLQHPPRLIPSLVEALKSGKHDFVVGSRFTEGGEIDKNWKWFRHLNSWVATMFAKPLVGKTCTDPMAGFFALPKSAYVKGENLAPLGYKIGLELMIKCKCQNIKEVPIEFEDRLHGESKLSLKEQVNYLNHVSHLYDFKYPNLSVHSKFILTYLFALPISLLLYYFYVIPEGFSLPSLFIYYLPFMLVHGLLNLRYVKSLKEINWVKHPIAQFAFITSCEIISIGIAAKFILPNLSKNNGLILIFALTALGALGRFIGRKLTKQDKRPTMFQSSQQEETIEEICSACGNTKFIRPYPEFDPKIIACTQCYARKTL